MTDHKATAAASSDQILDLLQEQRTLYHELKGLVEHQRALISGNEPERLLAVLGQRQKLIDRLTQLSQQMKPYQQNWQDIRRQMSPNVGKQVDALVDEVNASLSAILEKDRSDADMLATRKNATASAMKKVHASRQAGAAYAAASQNDEARVRWTGE